MAIIDPSWVELQTGLYQEIVTEHAGTLTIVYSKLHSSDGYCFYDVEAEIYDEEGNLIAPEDVQPNQRLYYQYCATPITDINALNAKYVSVQVQEGFEIANINPPTEIM